MYGTCSRTDGIGTSSSSIKSGRRSRYRRSSGAERSTHAATTPVPTRRSASRRSQQVARHRRYQLSSLLSSVKPPLPLPLLRFCLPFSNTPCACCVTSRFSLSLSLSLSPYRFWVFPCACVPIYVHTYTHM